MIKNKESLKACFAILGNEWFEVVQARLNALNRQYSYAYHFLKKTLNIDFSDFYW